MRSLCNGNKTGYLNFDRFTAHLKENVKSEIEKIGDVKIITNPAYSSHLSQILDTSFLSIQQFYLTPQGSLYE